MLYGIFLIVGVVLISRNEKLRGTFYKWFGGLVVGLFAFYLLLDVSMFRDMENTFGILLMAFIIAMLASFINKWLSERNSQ